MRRAIYALAIAALLVSAGSGAAATGECTPDTLQACGYGPSLEQGFTTAPERIVELDYTDITGSKRRFSIALRRPLDAPEPLPIVVWSHGGALGQNDPAKVATGWGRVFTGAGYLFVAIAHHQRGDVAARLPICRALGYDEKACERFKFLNWDRPHDVARVLDWIDQQAAGPLQGRIEPRRLAYAGHSAGAGAALAVAGAGRDFAGNVRTLSDPRPLAFIGDSPQGVGYDGFEATSFEAISRPFLTLSGVGDATNSHPAQERRDAFERMMPGNAFLGWITDPATRHGTFNLEARACMRGGAEETRCAKHLEWLAAAALAFVDSYLRGDVDARAYLESERLGVLSGGAFELSRR